MWNKSYVYGGQKLCNISSFIIILCIENQARTQGGGGASGARAPPPPPDKKGPLSQIRYGKIRTVMTVVNIEFIAVFNVTHTHACSSTELTY